MAKMADRANMVINTLPEAIVDAVTNLFRKYFTRKQSNFDVLSRGVHCSAAAKASAAGDASPHLAHSWVTHTTEVRSGP